METIKQNQTAEALKWRYATKVFDKTKKLSEEQLQLLKQAVQLAPSSYGLQPYQVLIVSNPEIKEKLKEAAFGQSQLTDASHIFVFARTHNFTEKHVDEYAINIAETRGIDVADIKGFVDVMKGTVNSRSQDELANWNAKQAYIALGVLLETAALHEIDACLMEGFNNAHFDGILGLADRNLTSVVIASVGFRSSDDGYQNLNKVRKSDGDLFIHI
ncbi:MAG: NAD(P)H-dependent oxidoreductase [Bacteroidetes bacterium]|nr:NAD(P)H-dependent oxidoreductase [Bacteroidota bacterium]MBU1373930.1 NAD(P)H-dependent oxidoreductase [Bacteroidota bacterium]MBU1485535.1 NAD(P)H-dependent oxidoreductase [Bacteroidota bacterium]MBU1761850.1 NAD(P)H-dependent oxidoreductase [Bacteroidota bacterium]MBU2046120.1 NAD(P)H-dependent oxidoreductase [Bacteroidota bacterium]